MNELSMESGASAPAAGRRPAGDIHVALEQMEGFEFRVRFHGTDHPELVVDEPPPLGRSRGPNPARVFAAAIGNCLAASLLFSLHKAGLDVVGLEADVGVELVRNERNRLRVGRTTVHLRPHLNADEAAVAACLASFEDFCIVTGSVREGMQIDVDVTPVTDDAYGCEG